MIGRLRRHPTGVKFRIQKQGLVDKPESIQKIEWEVVSWGKKDDERGDDPDRNNGNHGDKGAGDLALAGLATSGNVSVDSSNGFQGQRSELRLPIAQVYFHVYERTIESDDSTTGDFGKHGCPPKVLQGARDPGQL